MKLAKTYKSEDNVDTLGIKDLLIEMLNEVKEEVNPDFYTNGAELFEYESRDGFIPHSWNRGGADLLFFTSISHLYGSGFHCNTKVESHIEKVIADTYKTMEKEHSELKDGTEEFYETFDSYINDEYSDLAWRVRIMYEGDGVIKVYSGWDLDAPYFRWNNSTDLEQTINFKTAKGLKTQLKKALKKAIEAI